jgi:hypothetical protein
MVDKQFGAQFVGASWQPDRVNATVGAGIGLGEKLNKFTRDNFVTNQPTGEMHDTQAIQRACEQCLGII